MDVKQLKWENLTYIVQKKKHTFLSFTNQMQSVVVLDHASGFLEHGTLTAVIGPSGSGKTSFIAALSQRIRGNVHGNLYLNKMLISGKEMKSYSAFVPQHDISIDCLTPMEHLNFLACLQPSIGSQHTKIDIIIEVIESLGLLPLLHTQIGLLSGGQKRKLTLAGELLTNPQILFLDEPTTGLDSFSAYSVIKTLRNLAGIDDFNGKKHIVLCSIHQPSSDIFHQFTNIILMQAGKIVVQGSFHDVETEFLKVGLICPHLFNAAEFYIQAVSLPSYAKIIEKLEASMTSKEININSKMSVILGEDLNLQSRNYLTIDKVCWIMQVMFLMQRNWKQSVRNIREQSIETMFFLCSAVILGILYHSVKPESPNYVQDVKGAFFTVATEIVFTNIYFVVYLIPSQMPLLRRETGEGLYTLSAFYLAKVILMVPKVLLETFVFLLILYFFTQNSFSWSLIIFLKMLMSLSFGAFGSMSYGFLLSGMFQSIKMTLEMAPPLDMCLLMLSGIYININSFPYGKFVSFFYYTNEATTISYWENVTEIFCLPNTTYMCLKNGTEVLESLGYGINFNAAYGDLVGLMCLSMICHLLGYFAIKRSVNLQGFY